MAKRIGILTGGGDVPGLNSVIKGVVYRGTDAKYEIVGIRRGWKGLTHLDPGDGGNRSEYIVDQLTRELVRTIDRTGGTWLHTSRTNPKMMKKIPDHLAGQTFPSESTPDKKTGEMVTTYDVTPGVLRNLEALKLDYLVAIGGDDTLSYAAHLDKLGFKVVAIPKTMDNDVRNTEYCIGFSTAISRAMDAINRQRSTIGSHERAGIFRVFGRDAGYTALYTAYVTSARCAIPEFRFNAKKMIEMLMKDKKDNPSNYCIAVLSEGAEWEGYVVKEYGEPDDFGHYKKMSVAEAFSDELVRATGAETVVSDLTYDLRSGEADFVDKMVALTFAGMAVDCILQGQSGKMTSIVNGCYTLTEIPDPALGPRHVDLDTMYNTDRYRPTYDRKIGLPLFLTRP